MKNAAQRATGINLSLEQTEGMRHQWDASDNVWIRRITVYILVGDLVFLLTFLLGRTTMQIARDGSGAQLLKSAVVKTPLSVYEATAGRELYRPVQTSPISNFFLAGCFTKQKYLASMEGATFSGKLAARALADAAMAGTVSSPTRKRAVSSD